MGIKKSFLSQFFGSEPENAEEETSAAPVGEMPAPAQQDLRHLLELPSTHSLYRLWTFCGEHSGWLPPPELYLEGPSDPLLPEEEAKLELFRLQMTVNLSANERAGKLPSESPEKPRKEDEQDPDLDAEGMVHIAKNGLTAWLMLYPPVGKGREADRETLDEVLKKAQVSFGIDEAALERLLHSQNRYFRLIVAARGTPAVHGVDGQVEDLFQRKVERKATVNEKGQIDYMNLNFIQNVEQGGVICRIIPPTQGVPGRTVQDQELPARDGKAAAAPKGRNTELSEDGSALLATIAGHVEFSGRSFQVRPVLDIPGNVDYSVGNISFLGDVHIRGDVCSGFSVRATGTITVDGVIEACSVEAGRDLIVAKGIQGDSQAIVRAQRSMFAKYIESSRIYAKLSLEADCIINSDIYCDGSVIVQAGHRSIIGGEVYAAHEVRAGILGNRVESRTEIILGGQPCEEFDYALFVQEIQNTENEIARIGLQPESPSKTASLAELQTRLARDRARLSLIQREQAQAQTEEPSSQEEGGRRYLVCGTVYPGVVLKIDGATHHFTTKVAPCRAALADGVIYVT